MSRTQVDLASQIQGVLSPTYGGISPVTQFNETIPVSKKMLTLQSMEINSSYSLEIPSTSSLEIVGVLSPATVALWDTNKNIIAANAIFSNTTTTIISGTTTTLSIGSAQVQRFILGAVSGASTQTVLLPSTGVPAGAMWFIVNPNCTLTIQAADASGVVTMQQQTTGVFIANAAPPSTNTLWTAYVLPFGSNFTFPASDTIVGTTASQVLTTKTLTNPTINNYVEGVVAIGTVTSSSTLSLTNGTVQTATLTASTACTFTMPSAVAGKSFILLLKQAASTGNGTATFTSVKWNGAGTPTQTATAATMDIYSFISDGTDWYGTYSQGYVP